MKGTRAGEVYELGPHRLLCGDSRDVDAVLSVMGGELAAVLWTDPPYGVGYTAGGARRPLAGDAKDGDATYDLLAAAFRAADAVMLPRAAFYIAAPAGPVAYEFQRALIDVGWKLHEKLVWVKDAFVLGHSDYHYRHEDILYGFVPSNGRPGRGRHDGTRWRGDNAQDTVFEFPRPRRSPDHPCLPPGELVLTDEGYEPIESLEPGRMVYADDGRFHPVTSVHQAPCAGPIYEIDVDGTNLTTKATGNHPFLAWRAIRKRGRITGGDIEWVPADELAPGDYLLTPVSQLGDTNGRHRTVDWWFAAGLWCAEGSVHTNQHGGAYPGYVIGNGKEYLIDRLRSTFAGVGIYPRQGASQVVVMEKGVVEQFVALVDRGAVSKRIRPGVLEADEACRRAFLTGYASGDGCIVRKSRRFKTASPRLASTLPLLIESLGVRSAMYRHDDSQRKPSVINGREIKPGVYFALYPLDRVGKSRPTFIEYEGRAFSIRRVGAVTEREYQGPVWNLTVGDRHTFQTAVGMSHNTTKPPDLIAAMLRNSIAAGEIVLDPFAGSGSTMAAAEAVGARAFMIEINRGYCDAIRDRYQEIAAAA